MRVFCLCFRAITVSLSRVPCLQKEQLSKTGIFIATFFFLCLNHVAVTLVVSSVCALSLQPDRQHPRWRSSVCSDRRVKGCWVCFVKKKKEIKIPQICGRENVSELSAVVSHDCHMIISCSQWGSKDLLVVRHKAPSPIQQPECRCVCVC